MSIQVLNFNPQLNYTVSATASNTNTVIAQPPAGAGNANGHCDLFIQNQSGVTAFVNWGMDGTSATATVAASFPIPTNAGIVVNMGFPATNIGVILASGGSGTVYLSVGNGT